MAIAHFIDENLKVQCEEGKTILEVIRKNNLKLETPCNGIGICGKCKVIAKGKLSEIDTIELPFINKEKNERLACVAKIQGDVDVQFIKNNKNLKTVTKGKSIDIKVSPKIKKELVNNLDNKVSIPYIEYVNEDVSSIELYEKIYKLESENVDSFEVVKNNSTILDIDNKIEKVYSVAIDIGTTGISSYLINLENGTILNKLSSLNPQTEFGGDVLTRITYCMENPNGLEDLQKAITLEINRLSGELIRGIGERKNIYNIAIAGNTTMLHLLLGISPISLAKAPYRPIFLNGLEIKATDLNIDINHEGTILILPNGSAYVGADIIAGVVASGFDRNSECSIFVDIGTNGEIVAINNGQIMGTSTAAGPALEGMNISCGCRAQEGAIEGFRIDENYHIEYSVIGDSEPIGICGSGLLDIAAELVKANVILSSGRFNKELPDKLKNRLKEKKFYITHNIYISQKDIRQIQLAKGAIAAGITMLLKEMNISIENVKNAYIAGAFGYHVKGESITSIGLIPKGFSGKIDFLGNTSLEGARLATINEDVLKSMMDLKEKISILELSTSEEFQKHFVKELSF
ncbi:ASKHA domain-containing protein [Clostridium sp. ATCC 25772]|uniref:ASKHA domain-containing protein n=1 Tax=Clostridium sp. ATCC 25772 TaxID=1676991 RepID=UPI000785EBDB|nr:ASKHA domain-containing protein [Clostridium sp. ATCC 25772]